MGWFNKQEKKDSNEGLMPTLPELPELPKLPDFPSNKQPKEDLTQNQLPSLPPSSLGDRFSQNMIKEAVTGKRGEKHPSPPEGMDPSRMHEEEDFEEVEELEEDDEPPMLARPIIPNKPKKAREIPPSFVDAAEKVKEAEPVFIRIDKFQESLNMFKKVKSKVSEVEELLRDIKTIKEEEEKELESWQEELMQMKDQIAKIDKDIFSKVD